MNYLQFIKNEKLIIPNHIAIIMDGNGRWAKKQSMLRLDGHKKGVDAVRKITRFCGEIGVKKLTLYTFSSENWKRPKTEIRGLMILLLKTIEKELSNLNKNNVRFTTIGELGKMPLDVSNMLRDGVNLTSNNDGLNLNLAVNYGGRQEITSICQEIADEVKNQKININDVTESYVNQKFALDNYYEPDLLIRTGGEFRISNFMLWQLAYSEIFVTKIFWPDFNEDALMESIINYNNRERRFGKISEQI
jgi:undecaprenyl diphosphate synthase